MRTFSITCIESREPENVSVGRAYIVDVEKCTFTSNNGYKYMCFCLSLINSSKGVILEKINNWFSPYGIVFVLSGKINYENFWDYYLSEKCLNIKKFEKAVVPCGKIYEEQKSALEKIKQNLT